MTLVTQHPAGNSRRWLCTTSTQVLGFGDLGLLIVITPEEGVLAGLAQTRDQGLPLTRGQLGEGVLDQFALGPEPIATSGHDQLGVLAAEGAGAGNGNGGVNLSHGINLLSLDGLSISYFQQIVKHFLILFFGK